MIIFGHVIGMIGMLFICMAFWLVTTERQSATDTKYLLINLSGAIMLIISLLINFNLGSFMIEVFWIYISLSALYKKYIKK
jgi:predicted membrane protein